MTDEGEFFRERKANDDDRKKMMDLCERYKRVWNGFNELDNAGKLSGTLNFLLSVLTSAEIPPEAVRELLTFAIGKYEKRVNEFGFE